MHRILYGCMLLHIAASLNAASVVSANISSRTLGRFSFIDQIEINDHWSEVPLKNQNQDQFASLLFVSPPSFRGVQPGVVRVRSEQSCCSNFEVRIQEYTYLDQRHVKEKIFVLGARPGIHRSEKSISGKSSQEIIAIGSFEMSGNGHWSQIEFPAMPGRPYVFLTAQTVRGGQPVSLRVRNVTNHSFEASLFEEENLMQTGHVMEKIAYLVMYNSQKKGVITIGDQKLSYQLQQVVLDHRWMPVLGVELKLEEERSADNEVFHVKESVDVLKIADHIFAQQVSSHGRDTTSLRFR